MDLSAPYGAGFSNVGPSKPHPRPCRRSRNLQHSGHFVVQQIEHSPQRYALDNGHRKPGRLYT